MRWCKSCFEIFHKQAKKYNDRKSEGTSDTQTFMSKTVFKVQIINEDYFIKLVFSSGLSWVNDNIQVNDKKTLMPPSQSCDRI